MVPLSRWLDFALSIGKATEFQDWCWIARTWLFVAGFQWYAKAPADFLTGLYVDARLAFRSQQGDSVGVLWGTARSSKVFSWRVSQYRLIWPVAVTGGPNTVASRWYKYLSSFYMVVCFQLHAYESSVSTLFTCSASDLNKDEALLVQFNSGRIIVSVHTAGSSLYQTRRPADFSILYLVSLGVTIPSLQLYTTSMSMALFDSSAKSPAITPVLWAFSRYGRTLRWSGDPPLCSSNWRRTIYSSHTLSQGEIVTLSNVIPEPFAGKCQQDLLFSVYPILHHHTVVLSGTNFGQWHHSGGETYM